ncbi:MAG TPA: sigma factor [Solirubrobacteraceae bacterium]|nr:sigma factor [Solirubrobacteraceae bacterium]
MADLTSETFAEALASLATFDPAKGAARPWLYAIARAVYARHRERATRHEKAVSQLSHQVELEESDIERHAIELVDLDGLTPKEAAASLRQPHLQPDADRGL